MGSGLKKNRGGGGGVRLKKNRRGCPSARNNNLGGVGPGQNIFGGGCGGCLQILDYLNLSGFWLGCGAVEGRIMVQCRNSLARLPVI